MASLSGVNKRHVGPKGRSAIDSVRDVAPTPPKGGGIEITIWSSDYLSEGEISLRVKSIMSPGKQSPPALASPATFALGVLWVCTSPTRVCGQVHNGARVWSANDRPLVKRSTCLLPRFRVSVTRKPLWITFRAPVENLWSAAAAAARAASSTWHRTSGSFDGRS